MTSCFDHPMRFFVVPINLWTTFARRRQRCANQKAGNQEGVPSRPWFLIVISSSISSTWRRLCYSTCRARIADSMASWLTLSNLWVISTCEGCLCVLPAGRSIRTLRRTTLSVVECLKELARRTAVPVNDAGVQPFFLLDWSVDICKATASVGIVKYGTSCRTLSADDRHKVLSLQTFLRLDCEQRFLTRTDWIFLYECNWLK